MSRLINCRSALEIEIGVERDRLRDDHVVQRVAAEREMPARDQTGEHHEHGDAQPSLASPAGVQHRERW
jgi:hypothetical protein